MLFGYTLIYLSYILPQPPAQIGSNEFFMVLIFSIGLGFDKEMVSAVMAFSHVITAVLITIVGFIAFSVIGINITQSFKDKELENEGA